MLGRTVTRVKDKGAYTVMSDSISEADRLNGIQWRGTVVFEAKGPSQMRYTRRTSYDRWSPVGISDDIRLEKNNTGWKINWYSYIRPVSCEEVTR